MHHFLTHNDAARAMQQLAKDNLPPYGWHGYPFGGNDYGQNLRNALAALGFSFLGGGHFAGAFKHPSFPGEVFKLGLNPTDSYLWYAAWARGEWLAARTGQREVEGVEFLPDVKFVERYADCYVVVLPELESFQDWEPTAFELRVQFGAAQAALNSDVDLTQLRASFGYLNASGIYAITSAARAIRKHFKGVTEFDLHSENVMIRRHPMWGTRLVITDPISYNKTKRVAVNPDRSLPVVIQS